MRSIKQIKNVRGKKILVRVDFNVPVRDGVVEDDFRIKKALPTIKFLSKKGAKVILITHLGKKGETLLPVAKSLNSFIKINFVSDVFGKIAKDAVLGMSDGQVVLLENLRSKPGEKKSDLNFAKKLASLADIYVNEAFPVSHRKDASIVLLPKLLPSYAGLQFEEEIKNLSVVLKKPAHPFMFIIGGAKFSTKIPLIHRYLKLADTIFIGGALLNDVLKAKGHEIGKSLTDEKSYGIEKIIKSKKIIIPHDVLVEENGIYTNKSIDKVTKNECIIDVGMHSVKMLEPHIKKSKLILWNGPLGKYGGWGDLATKKVLKMVANSKAHTVVGGGDTVVYISQLQMENEFSFVSSGGGATIDFLANGTLPGIKALL